MNGKQNVNKNTTNKKQYKTLSIILAVFLQILVKYSVRRAKYLQVTFYFTAKNTISTLKYYLRHLKPITLDITFLFVQKVYFQQK